MLRRISRSRIYPKIIELLSLDLCLLWIITRTGITSLDRGVFTAQAKLFDRLNVHVGEDGIVKNVEFK